MPSWLYNIFYNMKESINDMELQNIKNKIPDLDMTFIRDYLNYLLTTKRILQRIYNDDRIMIYYIRDSKTGDEFIKNYNIDGSDIGYQGNILTIYKKQKI